MTEKQKKNLYRIIVAAVLFTAGMTIGEEALAGLLLFAAAYVIVGYDVLLRAVNNIRSGRVFDEYFLMAVATIGAVGIGEYSEGVAVMLFYQVGEWFQSYAVNRSRRSISNLMDIRPDYANVIRDGSVEEVDPYEVEAGEIILIKPGERIPLDGEVVEGISMIDTAALTGESVPRSAKVGDAVISGCINSTGTIKVCTTSTYDESTVERILNLVESSGEKKARTEAFITRFARYYTPFVTVSAVLVAVIPPVLGMGEFNNWLYRALTFLVVSCPCALVISVPMSFFGGIGGASKEGVLIKGGNYLEALADAEIVVFDKTGTLTRGTFAVQEVHTSGMSREELLYFAAAAESDSSHPIARSIIAAYGKPVGPGTAAAASDVSEVAGNGIRAKVKGCEVLVGNAKLMESENILIDEQSRNAVASGTVVYVAVDGKYAGFIMIADEVKEDSAKAIKALKSIGVKKAVMLTGDAPSAAEAVAGKLGLDEYHAGLLPADKVAEVENLLNSKGEKKSLVFVGDGINDAPVLARADVGIAMGGIGSDAAIEAADVVLMTDEPSKLVTAINIARKTMGIAWQNIIFAIGIKAIVLFLGLFGMATLWMAVFADVGVAVIAILNAMRALSVKGCRVKIC